MSELSLEGPRPCQGWSRQVLKFQLQWAILGTRVGFCLPGASFKQTVKMRLMQDTVTKDRGAGRQAGNQTSPSTPNENRASGSLGPLPLCGVHPRSCAEAGPSVTWKLCRLWSLNADRDLRERWKLSSLCKGVVEETEPRGAIGCCGGRESEQLI